MNFCRQPFSFLALPKANEHGATGQIYKLFFPVLNMLMLWMSTEIYIYIYIYTHFKTQFLWIYEQIGRWRVIKMIAGKGSALRDIVGKESELVEKIYSWGLIKSQYKFVKHIYIFPWWHLIGLENHICRFLFVCISASDQTNDFWNTTFDEICPKLY
jgi:hypothetical protein